MTEFRVLGDLQLFVAGESVELGPLKQRTMLAALLMDAGRVVPTQTLIDRVWGSALPSDVRNVLYTYITRLRRMLAVTHTDGAPVTIQRQPGGYRLDIAPYRVDVHLLRRYATQARDLDPADPARADLLRRAVELWRGDPLAGLPGEWAARVREGLGQQLLGVLADWADSELRQGRPGPVADRLSRALDRYPLAEPLILHLMRALHADGRRAEALEQYARSRQRIADDLGVEPSEELRALHGSILRAQAPAPETVASGSVGSGSGASGSAASGAAGFGAAASGAPGSAAPTSAAPTSEAPVAEERRLPGCQLPADLPDHTGCTAETGRALAVLGGPPVTGGSRPVVVVSGPGGVGKTSWSVHVAHLLHAAYPDGQLFVSLVGSGREPGEVLTRVLGALGVPNLHQLRTVEDKLARYRAEISDKRLLIVLDDASGAEQVQALVPGVPGTALIVSSRARLTTIPGAEHVELSMLSPAESLTLLRRIVGAERVAAEPGAATDLVARCAGLPLAVRIVGARLTARPHWRISRLAERMGDERHRLAEMTAGGLAVRVSLDVGYRGLDPAAGRMFRLLGFLSAPDFGAWFAAAAAGCAVDDAEDLLEHLIDARLVDVATDRAAHDVRYRMHDLVRLYAWERAAEEDGDAELRHVVDRVLSAAIELVEQAGERLPYAVPRLYRRRSVPAAVDPSVLATAGRQPGWLDAEGPCLVSVVERAAVVGSDEAACVLADALVFASFALGNNFDGWNRAHAAALRAARATGNRAAQAAIECGIAFLRYKEDRFAEAERLFPVAIELYEQVGDEAGAAAARGGLGAVLREVGRNAEAVPLLERALAVLDRIGDRDGTAHAAYGLGYAHRELGSDGLAIEYLDRAAADYRAMNHWRGETIAIRGIGLVHRARGDLAQALRWSERAHDLVRANGDRHLSCYTGQSLAKVWFRLGRFEPARELLAACLAGCLDVSDRLGVALVRRTVGELHLAAGELDAAAAELELARTLWRQLRHDLGEARTLRDLGAVHAARGDCARATADWQAALVTFGQLGTRESGELTEWIERWGCGGPELLALVGSGTSHG